MKKDDALNTMIILHRHYDRQFAIDFTQDTVGKNRILRNERRLQPALPGIHVPPDVGHVLPPPFGWCEIPSGRVTLTGGAASFIPGTDTVEFTVERFWMATYPVTNGQYQAFLDDPDGYTNAGWWDYHEAAQQWRARHPQPYPPLSGSAPNHPRVNITWFEAVAFCRWLSARINEDRDGRGQVITLPTEQQWQRAAQGNDGRLYPYGMIFDESRSNTGESGIGQTTSVTEYPNGMSPFGVMDMSGNCWEWCLTAWESGKLTVDSASFPALRGGSWLDSADFATVLARLRNDRFYANPHFGFRVVYVGVPVSDL